MINRLIVPLTLAVLSATASSAVAQGAFPAPLPGQAAAPANDPATPIGSSRLEIFALPWELVPIAGHTDNKPQTAFFPRSRCKSLPGGPLK